MTMVDIKAQLISKIQVTDDKEILAGMLELLDFELNNLDTYTLTNAQKESIAISKNQLKEGKVYSEEEADKLTDKWLNE